MKKILPRLALMFFLIGLISFALNINLIFAQEVEYPDIPGVPTPSIKSGIPNYVKYIFNFAIWASGFIALGVLVYGGFKYLTSVGSPEKIQDAKEQITAAILGLIILFGSYLILVKINPQLVIFHLPSIPPLISTLRPGVLVCKAPEENEKPPPPSPPNVIGAWNFIEEAKDPATSVERVKEIKEQLDPIMENISNHCYYVETGGKVRKEFDKKIKYVYFIPEDEGEDALDIRRYTNYGAIIHEDNWLLDRVKVIDIGLGATGPREEIITEFKISSILPFIFSKPESGHKAVLYEEIDYNWGTTGTVLKTYSLSANTCTFRKLPFIPQSIEIKGDYIVILYTELENKGKSQIFIKPGDANLNDGLVSCAIWYTFGIKRNSCVKSACTYGAKLY